jgi:RNA polymerase sigma-70 factor (ECF subfamily)
LTQEFFLHLLETNGLASVDREKGRFRSFLLASMKNLMANDWNRARRQKRGGGAPVFSLDEETAEGRYLLEPQDNATPDKLFDRQWAETILARALTRLRHECDGAGKSRRFDEVKSFLLGEKDAGSLAEAAGRIGLTLAAVKGMVHRLRRRFRELIRDEIAQTVARPEDVDQEMKDLFSSFGG